MKTLDGCAQRLELCAEVVAATNITLLMADPRKNMSSGIVLSVHEHIARLLEQQLPLTYQTILPWVLGNRTVRNF